MLVVTDLIKNSGFPKEFLDVLPIHCDVCGEPTEITESLSMLVCSNLSCLEKAVQRMVALLKDLGVKNMGASKCRKFLEHFGTVNPYIILAYEPNEDGVLYDGASEDFSWAIYEEIDKRRTMLLWEYIKIGNMPNLRDSARKIFAEYDNLEEFYDDLEYGGIEFIQELLNIKEDSLSIRALEIYNTLMFFKEDLFQAIDFVDIKNLETQVINLCISTAVGPPYKSKADFIHQMNEEFGHKVHLNFLGSVTRDCHFLIWSKSGSKTSKVRKAESINEKRMDNGEEPIHIMTGDEFRSYLEEL